MRAWAAQAPDELPKMATSYTLTRRILSSSLPGDRRPSVLLVVIHSEPSVATATFRIRPWSRAKCAFGSAASVPSSATVKRHWPCSAATNAVERVMASPAGEQLLVGDQVAAGSVYASSPLRPSTRGQP